MVQVVHEEFQGSWPATAYRDERGELVIGDVSSVSLASRYGTPLYVFCEETLRRRARAIRDTFAAAYPHSRVVYAGKAYLSPALMGILADEGLGLDVVSGGEIYAGTISGVKPAAMIFHGNNKSRAELHEAVLAGVGLIAIDNAYEIALLRSVAEDLDCIQPVLLRLNPGVDPHTHQKMRTGATDSKFGFPIWDGQAIEAARAVSASPHLRLVGYHAHVGSQIFDARLIHETITAMMAFAAEVRDITGVEPQVIVPGGGFGVADDASGTDADVQEWANAAARALHDNAKRYEIALPEMIVEPGRSIIGPAGVALYEAGARKTIPGVRTYISVDGGMSDNIRPSLYGARYSIALANRNPTDEAEEIVTIAGKYCESGDILIESAALPRIEPGDLLALPMAGAYCLAMASNYNLAPRPAAVLVTEGKVALIRRRESYADMLRAEVFPVAERVEVPDERLPRAEGSL